MISEEEARKILSHYTKLGYGIIIENENTKLICEALHVADIALKRKPNKGLWIGYYDDHTKEGWYECDCCHTRKAFNTKFCPDCGCKKVGVILNKDMECD